MDVKSQTAGLAAQALTSPLEDQDKDIKDKSSSSNDTNEDKCVDSQKFKESGAAASGPPGEELLMWKPAEIENHNLEILRSQLNIKYKEANLENYYDLHRWSVKHYDKFWDHLWHFMKIKASRQPDTVINMSKRIDEIPKWFEGAKLNYAENLLRYPDDNKTAFYFTSERISETGIGKRSFGELRLNVARIASSMRKLGIGVGDRVVGYLPNSPEAIEIMAATASIGAIWSSTSPDFGVSGVLDRFQQISPKIIFSVEAVAYNTKVHDHLGKLRAVVDGLSSDLMKVVIVPFCHPESDITLKNVQEEHDGKTEIFMSEFLAIGKDVPERDQLKFEQLPFYHPLFIMFSSGTTGKPKCIVHGAGGTLMKHLEEHQVQGNRSDKDVLMYYTTTGWMMWNWMVSSLALGTTLVLYDGSPLHPHNAVMWDLVDSCGITVFGTSAKWIAVQEDRGLKPCISHQLKTLKVILSTGSPLKPNSYDYVYRDIKANVLLGSISGGTDIIACFMGENSVLPVHRGEIQSAHLGCGIECWDDYGTPLTEEGTPGDLICTAPFPSMPVAFWGDSPNKAAYRAAYFNKFEGVWAHGDFLLINPKTKGLFMLGRSDGTLNPNGVRFGSAEIYNIVECFPEIADSLCIGQKSPVDSEERVILFLKMDTGNEFGPEIVKKLSSTIRQKLSARHVPSLILPIEEIPYTVNGKKVEVAVKKILSGLAVKNQGALANPKCLELYKNIPETQKW